MATDAWIEREDAWWFTLSEDSIRMPGGEVLSLLWWAGVVQNELAEARPDEPLPPRTDGEALRRLEKCLCEHWGYLRAGSDRGETILETLEPSHEVTVFPDLCDLSAETIRRVVDEVASHKDEERDTILDSMVPS